MGKKSKKLRTRKKVSRISRTTSRRLTFLRALRNDLHRLQSSFLRVKKVVRGLWNVVMHSVMQVYQRGSAQLTQSFRHAKLWSKKHLFSTKKTDSLIPPQQQKKPQRDTKGVITEFGELDGHIVRMKNVVHESDSTPQHAIDPANKQRKRKRSIVRSILGTLVQIRKTINFFVSIIFFSVFGIVVLMAMLGVLVFYYIYTNSPDVTSLMSAQHVAETTIIYDRTGQTVLYEIHGEENRKRIDHEDIPDFMRLATIAAEDDAFYNHFGVDPFSILRAVKENFLQGHLAQGGSTITQQLARNVFLSREKTMERKIKEAVLAIKLERVYTKDEILDAYLNIVPYGTNAYGVQAAAEIFFGKDARDLTLDEAALLASLPKATATFSPYGNHTNRLIARQKMILERMRELGLVSGEAIDVALQEDTLSKIHPFHQSIISPHFVFYVIEQLEAQYGREFLERGGLRVYTTIDLEKQALAEDVVRRGVARNARYGAENASLVAINPQTGEIIAMVGSRDYYDQAIDGQVNVATRLRQPGSAFKPLAYAAAFEKGFQPETLLFDLRTDFGSDGSGRHYIPQNYDGRYHGLVSMRNALAMSLNIPAVKTLYLAGIDNTIDVAQRLGITTLQDRQRFGLALVLGGAEVKLVDITSAFGVFANEGLRLPAHAVMRIANRDGVVFYEASKSLPPARALRRDVAQKINSVLSDNRARTPAFGPHSMLIIPGRTVAAKTGTTQNYRDAWTIGYTPDVVVGVWAGNNDGHYMYPGAAGVYAAAPMWNDFMTQVLAGTPNKEFASYEKIDSLTPMVTGRLPKAVIVDNHVVGKHAKKKDRDKYTQYVVPRHSILYYLDKDHPLSGGPANASDPMLRLWEASLYGAQRKK